MHRCGLYLGVDLCFIVCLILIVLLLVVVLCFFDSFPIELSFSVIDFWSQLFTNILGTLNVLKYLAALETRFLTFISL